MMKKHMVGPDGLTIEESEKVAELKEKGPNEVETDEEIEEHLVIQEASDCSIPEEVVEVKDDDIDYSKFVIFY